MLVQRWTFTKGKREDFFKNASWRRLFLDGDSNRLQRYSFFVVGVLILQNSSLKFNTVVGNAILLNYAVSSENISELIKNKTENGFTREVNVCIFR